MRTVEEQQFQALFNADKGYLAFKDDKAYGRIGDLITRTIEEVVPTVRYVDTSEFYEWKAIQDTTWTPPKAGWARVLVEAGQNYKNYSDNINGEVVEKIIELEKKPYKLIIGKNGNWDHDADTYKPKPSQFGDIIANVGAQYQKATNRHNDLKGYVRVTYVNRIEE